MNRDKKMYVSACPTRTRWFERFLQGNKMRTGVIRRRNFGLSKEAIHGLLDLLERDWRADITRERRENVELLAVFVISSYLGGLRGEEVPLLSMKGLIQFWNETREHGTPHVMLTLRGKFKGETGARWHLLPIADDTRSKIPVRAWFCRMMITQVTERGRRDGWVFQRRDGTRARFGDYDGLFKKYMKELKGDGRGLIPQNVDPDKDLSLRRSLRKSSTSEASNQNVDGVAIDMNNRWRRLERSKSGEAALGMRELYSQLESTLPTQLRYSQAL